MATELRTRPVGTARARIAARTLRRDNWWLQPALVVAGFGAFVVYATFRALWGKYYYADPYLSPFFSPCLSARCAPAPHLSWLPTTSYVFTPAFWVLAFPGLFRLTCYYYRKAYYRSFWLSPPACAVAEPHQRYTGETRFPLILQNVHRYFWYIAVVFAGILTWDAAVSFDWNGRFGVGIGSLVLLVNAVLIWGYTLSCHSCRHITGGRLNNFSKHPVRYRMWTFVSKINAKHMQWAWYSLGWLMLADLYILLVSAGVFADPHWVS